MKPEVTCRVLTIAILLALAGNTHAFPNLFGWKNKGNKSEKVERADRVEPTYIDSLNRGKEVRLTDADIRGAGGATGATSEASSPAGTADDGVETIPNGFRVQCFASSSIETARAERQVIESRLDLPAYIVFANPYYKIQVGDFASREQAEAAVGKVKSVGYPDAWIVRSKVLVKR
jgi:hypothetical protein